MTISIRALALATVWALASAYSAGAEDRPVVVELYTSQGCSSCPPADALLKELAAREDVIALALHVDYWDYIGWKDTFARPTFTQRQKGYARAGGHRTIYTPQMVIGGEDHVVGVRPMELADLIEAHQARPRAADLRLHRQGGELVIDIAPATGLEGKFLVHLVRFQPSASVEIGRGENAGRTIDYANIVTDWTRLAEWDGKAPLHLKAEADGTAPLAVLLQRTNYGPIVAAAALR